VTALSTASVIGREFDLPLLRDLCGIDPARGIGDLEPALLEGVVKEAAGSAGIYFFSHALIRETLYHQLAPSRRLALHFSAAELLERKQVADYAAAFQIAHHYFAAAAHKGADRALEWELKAAQKARDIFAYEQAVEHYRRALELLDLVGRSETQLCEIQLLLADAQRLLGQASEAIETFRKVEDLARESGLDAIVARAMLGAADVLRDGLATDGTMPLRIETALAKLPNEDSSLRARLMAVYSLASLLTKPLEERLALCEQAISMARRLGDSNALTSVLYWSTISYTQISRIDRALELATEMVELARTLHNTERLLDARLYRAGYLLTKGRRLEADTELQENARLARSLHHPIHIWWSRVASATAAHLEGRIDMAAALSREALELGRPLQGTIVAEAIFGGQLLTIADEYEGTRRRRNMEEIMAIGLRMRQAIPAFLPWMATLALAQFESGHSSDARLTFDQIAAKGFDKIPDDYHRLAVLSILARLARELRDVPRARLLYEQIKPHAGNHVTFSLVTGYWGSVSYHLGHLAAAMHETKLAVAHFRESLAESETMRAPCWTAWAECELGHLVDGEPGATLLRKAIATSKRLGLERLGSRAKSALQEAR
jgi:tetratricopeptide (TPR) repeat protein